LNLCGVVHRRLAEGGSTLCISNEGKAVFVNIIMCAAALRLRVARSRPGGMTTRRSDGGTRTSLHAGVGSKPPLNGLG